MRYRHPIYTNSFYPSNELLPNPHKGFCSFQRFRGDKINDVAEWRPDSGWKMEEIKDLDAIKDNVIGEGHPDTTLAYFRVPWRRLEPDEGVYDFSFIDFVLEEADRRGQKVIFRFYPNVNRPGSCELPDWFREKLGMTEEREVGDKRTPNVPEYFSAFSALIRKIGEHIDGDERLSAVDIAFISAWGEDAQMDMVKESDWRMIADAFIEGFPNTPLTTQFNHSESIRYINERHPVGLRADCVGDMVSHMFEQYPRVFCEFGELWKRAPINLEVCWVIDHWLRKGWDIDYIIEESLKWHITSFNEKSASIPDEVRGKVDEWIKRMGYRFAIRTVDYPHRAEGGDMLHIVLFLENRGVAPIYHKYPFVLRLSTDGENYDFDTGIDITKLMPGGYKFDIEIMLPYKIKGGKYSLLAGITDGKTQVLFATDAPRVDGFTLLAENIEVFG